jgi:hypothetical protein
MKPINFKQQTNVLQKPENMTDEECAPLPAAVISLNTGPIIISCWEPSIEELEEINKNKKVWLTLFTISHPPVDVSGFNPFITNDKKEEAKKDIIDKLNEVYEEGKDCLNNLPFLHFSKQELDSYYKLFSILQEMRDLAAIHSMKGGANAN